ncbi:MAG: TRAP transporter large permease subunit [Gammaproteobacteria bacterium]|nr:TRAP transporter large permease subunit [Gammaproteobacteria bacterium]MDE2723282.1 TRAP transporter large permease subunit [Gemmatimonadota bacterium]MXY65646.1 TRAP transporter large permease subunit [Gammaproteobacteria bacterium]MYG66814.1 TRAP transporter large permease subunit [Gammaproteobacteria bacterium]
MILLVDYLPVLMFAALAVLLFTGFPVGFILGGVGLGFGFLGALLGVFSVNEFFNLVVRIYGGVAENMILTAIPMFILMGTMLERSGVAHELLHCLQILFRRTPGGLAIAVTMMGTIMAATTGIVGASVVMMTLMALPVMMARGYSIPMATGTIGAAGTLGILIPPSIMLVIMADLLVTSVGTLFIAALIPGLLLASLFVLYIAIFAWKFPHFAPPLPRDDGPDTYGDLAALVIRAFLPPLFLMFLVLGSIAFGWATPTEAAGVGAFGAILLAAFSRKLSLSVLQDVLVRSMRTNAMLFLIFIGATAFAYVFRSLGGDFIVGDFVESMGLGSWGVLLLMMAVIFLLGFFLEWIEITLIVIPIFTPIIRTLDFGAHLPQEDVIHWFALLVAINLQSSFLTPPFGITLFYMKGTAPAGIKMEQIYLGIIPFVALQMIGLGLIIAFPAIALWLPHLVFD